MTDGSKTNSFASLLRRTVTYVGLPSGRKRIKRVNVPMHACMGDPNVIMHGERPRAQGPVPLPGRTVTSVCLRYRWRDYKMLAKGWRSQQGTTWCQSITINLDQSQSAPLLVAADPPTSSPLLLPACSIHPAPPYLPNFTAPTSISPTSTPTPPSLSPAHANILPGCCSFRGRPSRQQGSAAPSLFPIHAHLPN